MSTDNCDKKTSNDLDEYEQLPPEQKGEDELEIEMEMPLEVVIGALIIVAIGVVAAWYFSHR